MGVSRSDSVTKDVLFIGGLVVLAVGLILYLVMGADDSGTSTSAEAPMSSVTAPGSAGAADPTAPGPGSASTERRVAGDPLALGDPAAPVVMVMFADYRCPFCAKFSRDTEPELIHRFVDAGTLRVEWRDFPIFGEQSMLAARAGRAAAEQGRFWDFNRAVFAAAPERGHPDLTEAALQEFARQAGVPDIAEFTAGMKSTTFDAAINEDLAQGNRIGVPSTPAFVINGEPVLGAQPTDVFISAIDTASAAR